MQGGELELTYGEAEKLRAGLSYPDTPQPKVELHCIELSKAETDEQSPQKRETEADFVAARIRRMLDEKMQVSSGGVLRDVQPGDIVILMRAVGDNAASYQSALSKQSIASRCDRGGSLFDTTEAQVLLAALKVIDNPHRDVELVTALSILILPLVWVFRRRSPIGAGLALGGGLSNLWERLRRGTVYDYVQFPKLPKLGRYVWNLADLAILIGGLLLALLERKK